MSPYEEAFQLLKLSPQEQYLYMHHLGNLVGGGRVQNPDGTISTVEQAVVSGPGGLYYNIPTVWGGQKLTIPEAVMRASQSGWDKWPSYPTPEQADLRYESMHPFFEKDVDMWTNSTNPRRP